MTLLQCIRRTSVLHSKLVFRQQLMLPVQVQMRTYVKSMEERREEEMRKAFRDDIKFFLSKEEFNLFDFQERVTVSPTC